VARGGMGSIAVTGRRLLRAERVGGAVASIVQESTRVAEDHRRAYAQFRKNRYSERYPRPLGLAPAAGCVRSGGSPLGSPGHRASPQRPARR
jgi:hypothetical protein